MEFVDRISGDPGRVKIKPENGSEYYATIERADNPIDSGTPINAENLNAISNDMVSKSGDEMYGALSLPAIKVKNEDDEEKSEISARGDTVIISSETQEDQSATVQLKATGNLGGAQTTSVVNLKSGNYSTEFYPDGSHSVAPGIPAASLGTSSYPWTYCYTNVLKLGKSVDINNSTSSKFVMSIDNTEGNNSLIDLYSSYTHSGYRTMGHLYWEVGNYICNLYPRSIYSGYGAAPVKNLGYVNYEWSAVYATNGTIQTSDRASKDDIRYVLDESAPMALSLDEDTTPATPAAVTVGDVMDFVRSLAPVTFCYKNGADSADEATSRPESIQLGLIADDIKTHPLFKYIGVENEYEETITPEEIDENGEIVKEAVTAKKKRLGLQAIPLATVALIACKKSFDEIEVMREKISDLEEKLNKIIGNQK